MNKKYRTFALFSGGLDSILAVLYMKKLGYEVIPVFFKTPFFTEEKAKLVAQENGFELLVIDLTSEHLIMMKNPRYGFGKNMNPCIDCHGLMYHKIAQMMEEYRVDFLISGEVLGQRPMSQRKDALNSVAKLSSVKDLIIRPLSQKLLSDTKPIREGWIDKNDMLDIQGRGRHRQLEMAKEFKLKSIPNSGGGCLLTDIQYSRKLKDLMDNGMFEEKFIKFLNVGRHFHIDNQLKFIVGRNSEENNTLSEMVKDEIVMKHSDLPGPFGVINASKDICEEDLRICASLLLRYHKKNSSPDSVSYGKNFHLTNSIQVTEMSAEETKKYQI